MFKTGLAFLGVWLIVTAIVFGSEEPPLYLAILPLALPFAQAFTFTLHRTNHDKQKIGAIILGLMVIALTLFYLRTPVPHYGYSAFLALFAVVSFASAVLHTSYGFIVSKERKSIQVA